MDQGIRLAASGPPLPKRLELPVALKDGEVSDGCDDVEGATMVLNVMMPLARARMAFQADSDGVTQRE